MHVKPKKSLGQHFLTDKNIQKKIVDACCLRQTDTVLEIGAGQGELTRLIARKAEFVFALEIDKGLCRILKNNLSACPNTKVINRDILKLNFKRLFAHPGKKIKVVGNIPYCITTPIIKRLLESADMLESAFITVQDELAKRIVAAAGSKDYGSLSCFVQYYTCAENMFKISRNCFRPRPKVNSCLVSLKFKPPDLRPRVNEELLFKIIRCAFNKRRKTLRNSLKEAICRPALNQYFVTYSVDPDIRPESLSLQDFISLANLAEKKLKKH